MLNITIELGDRYTIEDRKSAIKSIFAVFTAGDSNKKKYNLYRTNFPIQWSGGVCSSRRNGILHLHLEDMHVRTEDLPTYADDIFRWVITDLIDDLPSFKSIPLKVTVGSYTDNTKNIYKTSTKSVWYL